jgi:hypothetical protein
MNLILVNGRTPTPKSFCARCCEPIWASYLRDLLRSQLLRGQSKFAEHAALR